MNVRPERTGWRDERISARHREWGFNCPAVDLDFLVVEYNLGLPVALVEYKHVSARMPSYDHATYRALRDLSDNYLSGALPFLLVFYEADPWTFRVYPQNEVATAFYARADEFDGKSIYLTERRFVKSLYVMRGLVVEDRVIANLDDSLPMGGAA